MPNDDGNIEVKYPGEDFRRDTYFIPPERYDPDQHTLADGEDWTPEGEEKPEPSDQLKDTVGTRQANALAKAGIRTIEEALTYEGDLTEISYVGDGTVEKLLDASDQDSDS